MRQAPRASVPERKTVKSRQILRYFALQPAFYLLRGTQESVTCPARHTRRVARYGGKTAHFAHRTAHVQHVSAVRPQAPVSFPGVFPANRDREC